MSWCIRTSVAVNRSTFCTSSLILCPAPSSTGGNEQATPGATGGTARSISSGIQLSSGLRVSVSEAVAGFAGLKAGASGSGLLLKVPDFWANDGEGPDRQAKRRVAAAIHSLPLVIIHASPPCKARAE